MARFIITNVYNLHNEGEKLQLKALVKNLGGHKFNVISPFCKSKNRFLALGRVFSIPLNRKIRRIYQKSDAVISLGGDTFSDIPNILYTLTHCINLLPSLILRKPFLICSESIGPFKTPFTKLIAKFFLKKAYSISVRDPISKGYLEKLGIESELHRDIVYLLSVQNTNKETSVIGYNPSPLIQKYLKCKREDFLRFNSNLVESINKTYKVIIIPHVGKKDLSVAPKGYAIFPPSSIGNCNLFIGSRMHSCVTAINNLVPSIVLSYSIKFSGIPALPWVRVIDVRKYTLTQLLNQILEAIPELISIKPCSEDLLTIRKDAEGHTKLIKKFICKEKLLGNYIRLRAGYSAEPQLRTKASSGGIVSSLLKHFLNETSVPVICSDGRKFFQCNRDTKLPVGFSYCLSENTVEEAKLLLKNNPNGVVVGLPCQIRNLRKSFPDSLYIGLFCSHLIKPEGINSILNHYNPGGRVVNYKYKNKSGIGFLLSNGIILPNKYIWSHFFNFCFIPRQCIKCKDQTSELADISVGDAWGFPDVNKGLNVIITRTEKGETLIKTLIQNNKIVVKDINPQEVIKSQSGYIQLKKGILSPKLKIYQSLRLLGTYLSEHKRLHPLLHIWLDLYYNFQRRNP